MYNEDTKLIHDYIQTGAKEDDMVQYTKGFFKGIFDISIAIVLSGTASFIGSTPPIASIVMSIVFVGVVVTIIII